MRQLIEKHSKAQEARLGSLLFGPVDDILDVLFQQIYGEMIKEAALRTTGAGGPSGIDANGFKRMLGCRSSKKLSTGLCDALAVLTRKLCTELVDPRSIESMLSNRLISLDQGHGAPGASDWRGRSDQENLGKCVARATKQDAIDASGSLRVCAGHKSGSEAEIHAMQTIFEADDTDAVLLIDASNAFNSLNRDATVHNIRVLCPSIATYALTRTENVQGYSFLDEKN